MWTSVLNPHRALLVIWFTRNWVEGTLCDLVGIGLHKVKRHEDLTGRNDLCDAKFHTTDSAAMGHHIHVVMRFEIQASGIARVHLQPRIRRHAWENWNLSGLGARVPVFDRAARIQDQWKFFIWLFRKRFPLNGQ